MLAAALAVGAASAVALVLLAWSFEPRQRASLRWGIPVLALVPLGALVAAGWRIAGAELAALHVAGAVVYGPVVVTVALAVFGFSRPFARGFARHPLFWAGLPNVLAAAALVVLLLFSSSAQALPTGDTTLTKTLTAQFTNGGTSPSCPSSVNACFSSMSNTNDQLAFGTATPSATTPLAAGSAIPTTGAGAGAHTLQSGTVYLLVRGNAATSTAYYDGLAGAYSGTAGPTLPTAVGAGGFSLPRGSGTFLLVVGGNSKNVYVVDPTTGAIGSWTVSTPAFTLQGATGAGAGAHAIKRTDGRFVIVHGAGNVGAASTLTSIYTPPGVFTTTSTTTVAPGSVTVTVANSSGITVGDKITVDTGAAQETVTVSAVSGSTFTATFAKSHGPSSWPVSTTGTTTITAGVGKVVTPRSMAGIGVGSILTVDTGASQENVTVTAATATTFTATYANAHTAPYPVVTIESTFTGPATSAVAGDGALSIPMTATNAGQWTTFLGNASLTANVYDGTAATLATNPLGTFAAAAQNAPTGAAPGAGANAIQYNDGTLAGALRWLVFAGGGLAKAPRFKFDPSVLTQTLTLISNNGDPTLSGGTFAYKQGDGKFRIVGGGGTATTTSIWDPAAAALTAGTTPAVTLVPGPGGHAFQQTDGQMVLVLANTTTRTTTNVHDAGWTATYTSEMINPTIVDFWDQLSWTTSAPLPAANSIKISVRTGTDTTLPTPTGATTYQDFYPDGSGTGTATGAITTATAPQGKRFIQVKAALTRTFAASPDAETGVWLGSDSLAYDRAAGAVTTSATAVSPGSVVVTPASMAGIAVGSVLAVDVGAAFETVTVTAATGTTFTATFANTHSGTWAINGSPVLRDYSLRFLRAKFFPTTTTCTCTVAVGTASPTPASMTGIVVGSVLTIDAGTSQETVTVTAVTGTTFTATFAKAHSATPAWVIVLTNPVAGSPFSASLTLKDSATPQNTVTEYTGAHTIFFSGANNAPDGSAPLINPGPTPFGGNTSVTFSGGATLAGATLTLFNGVPATSSTSTVAAGTATVTPLQMDGIVSGARLLVDIGGVQEYVTVTATTATTFTANFVNAHGPASWTIAQQPQALSGNENFTSTSTAFYLCAGSTACAAQGPITVVSAPMSVTVSPGAINAADSDTSANPSTVAAPGSSTITTNVRDTWKNPINGVIVTLTSSRGAADTISPPPGGTGASGQLNGQVQAVDTSSTIGTPIITIKAGGTTLNSVTISFTAAPGQSANVILVKDSQTLLNASGIFTTNTNVTGGNVQLNASNAASTVFCSTPLPCGAATQVANGPGAHTLQGNGGQYLTFNGNGTNSASLYDGQTGYTSQRTFRDVNNIALNLGAGAHSILLPAGGHSGQFLTVLGGGSARTMYVDPGFPQATATDPSLSGGGTAGAGAFSIAISGNRFLIVHGGTSTATSIYQTSTDTFVAGPALTAAAGAGAHAIPLTDGTGRFLIVHGGGANTTTLFNPSTNTTAAGSAIVAGTAAPVGAGGHAAQLGATSWLIVIGGASNRTVKLDTTALTYSAGTALSGVAGAGAHTMQRADGKLLVVHGGALTTTSLYTPGTDVVAAGPATSAAVGDGGHAFQQTDHRYVEVLGNNVLTTNLYDAGWIGSGTFATEYVTRADIDSWNKLGWTVAGTGTITLQVEASNTDLGVGQNASTTTVAPGSVVVTPTTMAGILAGSKLVVDLGGSQETVTVSAVTGTTFTATFANAHGPAAWPISLSASTSVAPGSVVVTVGNVAGLSVGNNVRVDTGAAQETVSITAVDGAAKTFTATFANAHTQPYPVVAVGALTFQTPLNAFSATNPSTLTAASSSKFARAIVQVTRPVPLATGAQAQVWLGSSNTVPTRTQTASPTLSSLSMGYRTGLFTLTGPATATAGVGFTTTLTLKDLINTTLATYTGSHQLNFDGASTAATGNIPTAAGTAFNTTSTTTVAPGSVVVTPANMGGIGVGTVLVVDTGASQETVTVTAVTVSTFTATFTKAHGPSSWTIVIGIPLTFASGATSTTIVLFTAETDAVGASEFVPTATLATFRISASYTIQPNRLTVVVSAADPSAAQSTVTANPTSIPADGTTATTLTVTAKDAFGNLSPGSPVRGVSVASSSAFDTITPTTGSVSTPQAVFTTSMTSTKTGTSTITATITGGASPISVTTTVTITVSQAQGADLKLTVVDGAGNPLTSVGAGVSFAVKVEVFNQGTTNPNTQYCNGTGGRTCSLVWTSTAGSAPDGTVPVLVANSSGLVISSGVFTTTVSFTFYCANAGGAVCLTETGLPTVTLTTTQASNAQTATGTSAGLSVTAGATDAARSFVLMSPSAAAVSGISCAPLSSPCAPTQIKVWARVLDQFRNAGASKTVSLATNRGVDTLTGTCTTCTDAYGFTTPFTLSSTTAGTSTLTATVGATTITTATATFFDSTVLRINDGTYFGTVSNGTVSSLPLAVVPTDALGKPFISQSGSTLTTPAVTWAASGAGAGTLVAATSSTTTVTVAGPPVSVPVTPSSMSGMNVGVPLVVDSGASQEPVTVTAVTATTFTATFTKSHGPASWTIVPQGCNGSGTTSAALLQTDFAAASHTTCFTTTAPGQITLTPSAASGTLPTPYTFTVVGYFDVTSTTTPSSRSVTTRVAWDGTTLSVTGWQASP